jgi:hypothetical protein
MLSVIYAECHQKALYAECHNAEYDYTQFQYRIIMLYIVKYHYAECQYSIIMLCIVKHHYAEFQYSIIMLCIVKHHYAEWHNAECRSSGCYYAEVFLLSVFILKKVLYAECR